MVRKNTGVRASVLGVVSALAVTACGSGVSPSASAGDSGDGDDFGAPEQTELTIALPYPDTSFMTYMVALEEGYAEEEGLTIEEIVVVDDTRAALVSESVDVAVVDVAGAYQAVGEGLGIEIIAGNFCRTQFGYAAQPEIESVADLAGEDVILVGGAGDTAEFQARKVLAEEGWDLEAVDVNPVYVGYDSATWAEFFAADRVALTAFFSEDEPTITDAGGVVVVDALRPWADSVLMARAGWVDENPNTARRLLRALLRGADFALSPSHGEPPENWDRLLEIVEAHGLDTDGLQALSEEERVYVLGEYNICTNLYFDEEAWNLTIENQELEPAPFDDAANLEALLAAQESLGLENSKPAEIPWPAPGE